VTASLHETALALVQAHFAIFPCLPSTKLPATPRGCLSATLDPAQVNAWWRVNEHYNIGLACGPRSGIFAVDVDGMAGERELAALEAKYGKLPASVEVITPGGPGRHVYFKHPADLSIGNSVSKIAPGVDIRGQGGYVLSPPSRHPNGGIYVRSVDSADVLADAPQWLLDLVVADTTNGCKPKPTEEWRKLIVDGVDEGARNDAMARIAGHLLRRGVNGVVAYELVQAWNMMNCRPPLGPEEVDTVFKSIASREAKRRGLG
jgi:hypothetical protein